MAARSVENMVDRLRPGALVVTPGDRSDIILAIGLASLRGVPLAGLLLTCGESWPSRSPRSFRPIGCAACRSFPRNWTPMPPAAKLAGVSCHVSIDDAERMEQVIEFIAEHVTPRR